MSMEYLFTLKHQLSQRHEEMAALVERLAEAGCDDALVGIGQPGRLAPEFNRDAKSADAALYSALADVQAAVPDARLIEVAPDLVGLSDVADIVGMSRQNMRKLMLGHPSSLPVPVHEGSSSLWSLVDVLTWVKGRGGQTVTASMLEIAQAAMHANIVKEQKRLSQS